MFNYWIDSLFLHNIREVVNWRDIFLKCIFVTFLKPNFQFRSSYCLFREICLLNLLSSKHEKMFEQILVTNYIVKFSAFGGLRYTFTEPPHLVMEKSHAWCKCRCKKKRQSMVILPCDWSKSLKYWRWLGSVETFQEVIFVILKMNVYVGKSFQYKVIVYLEAREPRLNW